MLVVLLFSNCKNVPTEALTTSNRLDAKYGPSDHFFIQRAYPDKTLGIQAYENALFAAMQEAAEKNGTGFDGE